MPDRLYLDHNATSPLRPEVRDAMLAAMDVAHNPSSVHAEGRATKQMLEAARKTIADVLNAPKEGIIFTSGGTESDSLAVYGLVHGPAKVRRVMISATEHPAVLGAANAVARSGNVSIETVPVKPDGVVDLEALAKRLHDYDAEKDGAFVLAVMLANNETGVIQPVEQLGPIVWPKGGYVLVDAVQGFGKMPIDITAMGADMVTLGAHKVGGPIGIGALITKTGIGIEPMLRGGGQEYGRRSGTENVPAIAGFAKAAEVAQPADYARLEPIRDRIEAGLGDGVIIWGQSAPRLPNTSSFSAPGFSSETQVMVMDLGGIAVSAGSACSSGKVRQTGVLYSMGASEEKAKASLRVSLGWDTPDDAAEKFLSVWTRERERIAGAAA